MNRGLFQKILARIEAEPHRLDMIRWESPCGTTHCVAGHAVVETIGANIFLRGSVYLFTDEFKALAERQGNDEDVFAVAKDLLGLTYNQADNLFFGTRQHALAVIRAAADGREDDVRHMLSRRYSL